MLTQLGGEHTVDVDILPDDPLVLDVGCRGFQFDKELLVLRPLARILCFDPDPAITDPKIEGIEFFNEAITHRKYSKVAWQGDGDGAFIVNVEADDPGFRWPVHTAELCHVVENVTLEYFMQLNAIKYFDLVKLDCEGSEFGILEAWPGPIAGQISVEFHDFVNRNRWNDEYFQRLFAGPLRDYNIVKFDVTPLGPGPSFGHWDCLLVRK